MATQDLGRTGAIASAPPIPSGRFAGAAILAGLAILYAPLLYIVFQRYWREGASTHGPILLAGIAWGLWELRALYTWPTSRQSAAISAVLLFGGLLLYLIASAAGFFDLALASALPVGVGAILLAGGVPAARALWPLEAALIFAIPISDTTLDGVFLPAKIFLTKAVVATLALFGLPIGDSGAVISIGFNTLLIANACTGLQSLWALMSVGLLYIFFVRPADRVTTIVLLLGTAPLAIGANFIRLTVLVLISYYVSSSAAQQFHNYASYFEVALSIALFLLLHWLILLVRPKTRAHG